MKKIQLHWHMLLVLLAALLSACGGGGGGGGGSSSGSPPPQTTGSVTGTLSVSNGILPLSSSATAVVIQPDSSSSSTEDFVPGEIIVRFKDGIDEAATLAAILGKYRDIGLVNAGPIYPNGPYLLRTNAHQNKNISISDAKQQTKDAILRLRAEPAVQYAESNGIRHVRLMPDDPAFSPLGLQWDMCMINLPAAWEITTGSPSVIVAVLDTGIRSHPDLDPNVLSTSFSFNFVDMNSDPTEPLYPFASFHGTHVAGTIAAVGNNGIGMAGVAWNAKIMPVRVLGPLGGRDDVIQNGMLYAAGLPNSSGKFPSRRANVINMSLGSQGLCTQAYQDTINKVINAGVVIVVAAGNDGSKGNPIETPASCQGVIAVGAVDPTGMKATYSGSQSYVFIAAPGGGMDDGIHAGILSTLPAMVSGSNQTFKFMQGTSMAAPHVSGVVALMFSANPNLTPAQVKTILASTATPLSVTVPSPDTGYGLIDAGMAVAQAKGVPTPSVPIPYPEPSLANFKRISVPMLWQTTISNFGGSTLSLSAATTWVGNPVGGTWLSVTRDPLCASIAAFSDCMLTINVDPTGLPADEYYGAVIVTSNAGVFAILVAFQAGASPSLPPLGPMAVQLWGVDSTSTKLTGLVSTITTPVVSQSYNYTFTDIPPGCYVVVAGVDKNGDGVFGDAPDEVFTAGERPKQVCVTAGKTTNGIDFSVEQEQDDILDNL